MNKTDKLVYTLTIVIQSDIVDPGNIGDSIYNIMNNASAAKVDKVEIMTIEQCKEYVDKIDV